MKPRARREGILRQDADDDLVLYDLNHNRAHALNRTAALVWRYADGERSVADLAGVMQRELGTPPDEELVWLALDQLARENLLAEPPDRVPVVQDVARRELLKRVGQAAALTLLVPSVVSIFAPTAAQAASGPCTPVDHACGIDAPNAPPCCPGTACTDCGKGRGFFVCKSTC